MTTAHKLTFRTNSLSDHMRTVLHDAGYIATRNADLTTTTYELYCRECGLAMTPACEAGCMRDTPF